MKDFKDRLLEAKRQMKLAKPLIGHLGNQYNYWKKQAKRIEEILLGSKSLNKEEKIIYFSVLSHFPATSIESAKDAAIQGGLNFQFIPR